MLNWTEIWLLKRKKKHFCNNTNRRDTIKTSRAKYYFLAVKGSSLLISRESFHLASIALEQNIWGRTEAQRLVDEGGPGSARPSTYMYKDLPFFPPFLLFIRDLHLNSDIIVPKYLIYRDRQEFYLRWSAETTYNLHFFILKYISTFWKPCNYSIN